MRTTWMMTLALAGVLTLAGTAHAGPVGAAKDAVDPDCTAGKAVKGAAERAAVGVGNRCKPADHRGATRQTAQLHAERISVPCQLRVVP